MKDLKNVALLKVNVWNSTSYPPIREHKNSSLVLTVIEQRYLDYFEVPVSEEYKYCETFISLGLARACSICYINDFDGTKKIHKWLLFLLDSNKRHYNHVQARYPLSKLVFGKKNHLG